MFCGNEIIDGVSKFIYKDYCVWNDVSHLSREIHDLYNHYEKGFLKDEGGIDDQLAWYSDAMIEMSNAYGRSHREKMEQQEASSKSRK